MITTEVGVMVISRRGKGGWFRAGDKAVEVSVGVGIVRHLIRNGGKVCSLTINCVAHNL